MAAIFWVTTEILVDVDLQYSAATPRDATFRGKYNKFRQRQQSEECLLSLMRLLRVDLISRGYFFV